MDPIQWKEQYSVGDEKIDSQHKHIFQLAENYRCALKDGGGEPTYKLMLKNLIQFCKDHFGYEEGCMARHSCPAACENKASHKTFLETITGYQTLFDLRGFKAGEAEILLDTVEFWLVNHICRIDSQLKPYINK